MNDLTTTTTKALLDEKLHVRRLACGFCAAFKPVTIVKFTFITVLITVILEIPLRVLASSFG